MLKRKVAEHIAGIDERISKLMVELDQHSGSSDEYEKIAENITKLVCARDDLQSSRNVKKDRGISLDTVVTSVTGLVTVAMVIHHEQTDIVTSKAMTIANKWLGR